MNKVLLYILIIIVLSVLIHLLPFIIYGQHPLGYDMGFYRRYLVQPFYSFPNPPVPGLGQDALGPRIFLDIWRSSGLSADAILYGSYVFLWAAGALMIFLLAKYYWNPEVGLLAALLYIISPVQYTAYWFMFYKNAFAAPIMLAAFLFIEKKSWLALPLGLILVSSHQTTGVIFLLTLAIFLMINKDRWKITLATLAGSLIVFLYLHPSAFQEYASRPVGVFMKHREYLILSLPFFILAVFGIKKTAAMISRSLFTAFALISAVFPVFLLPFYERVFIFTDLAVIIFAAFGLENLLHKLRTEKWSVNGILAGFTVIIALTLLLGNEYRQFKKLRPLLSKEEIRELEKISMDVPLEAAVITSTPLAPWVQGWSQNRIFAPGLLADTKSVQEWDLFSRGSKEIKKTFLKSFPRPLYIFLNPLEQKDFFANFQNCVQPETTFIFKYICD